MRELNSIPMKTYQVITHSAVWSMSALIRKVEQTLHEKTKDGYEIVTVAFGVNLWWLPTAFITVCK